MSNRAWSAVASLALAIAIINSIVTTWFICAYVPARDARDRQMADLLQKVVKVMEAMKK